MLSRDPLRFLVNACSIILALSSGTGCYLMYATDAEIGCGVDAQVSLKCPNRPPSPDASVEAAAVREASVEVDAAPMGAEVDNAASDAGTTTTD